MASINKLGAIEIGMLKAIKKFLGIRKDIEGYQMDPDNSWTINKINNRNKVLARIIELAPLDSIWSIEGLKDESIYNAISKHLIADEKSVWKGTLWPKQDSFKVKLTVSAKEEILETLPEWNLDWNIIHQHIYKDLNFFFTSYDNLDEACTWISKEINKAELDKLKEENVIDYYDATQK